jgi:hypothetical protein
LTDPDHSASVESPILHAKVAAGVSVKAPSTAGRIGGPAMETRSEMALRDVLHDLGISDAKVLSLPLATTTIVIFNFRIRRNLRSPMKNNEVLFLQMILCCL